MQLTMHKCYLKNIAEGRAAFYSFLANIYGRLPTINFLEKIKGERFNELLLDISQISEYKQIREGINSILLFLEEAKNCPFEQVLESIAIDRTNLLRGVNVANGPKPPYEGVYKEERPSGGTIIKVKQFYRKMGFLPDEVNESPDFIALEIDFMKTLCQKEKELWDYEEEVKDILLAEKEFLDKHLGSWINKYCEEAKHYTKTKFYYGILLVTEGFIQEDKKYLSQQLCKLKPDTVHG